MSEPAVVTVIREWREDLAAREASQFSAMAAAWKDVEGTLEDRMFSLAAQIADEGGVPSLGQLGRMERYTELLRQLRIETQRYGADLVPTIEGEQLAYGRAGIESAVQAIGAVGGPSIAGSFNVLPVSAVENMVGLAGDGSPLVKLLDETWPDGAAAMTLELIRSTALGVNPRVTARLMAKATEASLDRMMVIARSEQLRVFRSAALSSYEASGIVEGYTRICAHQRRTCAACLMADGTFYPLTEPFHEHPQGRCSTIPAIKGIQDPSRKTGQQWFLEQDAATQRDMLGKGHYDAWQAGAFRLEDIPRSVPNDTWGPGLQPRSLKALLAGERFERGTRPAAEKVRTPRAAKAKPALEPVVSRFGDLVRSEIGTGVKTTEDAKRVGKFVATEVDRRTGENRNNLIEQLAKHNEEARDRGRKALSAEAKMNAVQKKMDKVPAAARLDDEWYKLIAQRDKFRDQFDEFTTQTLAASKTRWGLEDRLLTVDRDTLKAALSDVRPMGGVKPLFLPGSDAQAKARIESASGFYPKAWLEQSNLAGKMLASEGERGFYHNGRSEISVNVTSPSLANAFHELGHRFEYTLPELVRLEEQFYKHRTAGEPLLPLGGTYKTDEFTRKDRFANPYMGKEYSDGETFELLTMGFESVYAGSHDLSKDPEMLHWVLGILAGV